MLSKKGGTLMIHLFNRKELAVVFSLEQRDRIAANLSQAGVDYLVKTYGAERPQASPAK